MTATTSPPPIPAPVTGRSKVGLWVALVALAAGVIVAALGGRAVISSVQRDQQIRRYTEARSTAQYFLKNGTTISAAMKRLQVLNDRDRSRMEDTRVAMESEDTSRFNALVEATNTENAEQLSLHRQVKDFRDAFDEAFKR